ncbi:MAG: DUF3667 domain-containing protein [Gemmatimonadetes bacterium]|nr:DUF3667 domain-containing protein [Gemmatimonadota bacterium]MYG33956.1 DUF3667 domain-containing protein [Gemmatimonadota bacterium]
MMSESNPDRIAADSTADGGFCPNCGRERTEDFCPQCGQNDRDYARAIGSVAGEFVRETFEVDSRLIRTLKLLLFKPGRLTIEFSRNRRASYMSPVRLYIFASFLFFLVLSLSGTLDSPEITLRASSDQELVESQGPADASGERVEAVMAELPEEYRGKARELLDRPDGDPMKEGLLGFVATETPAEMNPIERFFLFTAIDLFHNPSLIGERILGNLPIAMFFLLPLYALILAAFYSGRGRFLVEHLVFAIHVQTFVFIAYAVSLLLPRGGPIGLISLGFLLVQYPYFVIALRRYYGDGWTKTVAKSIGMLVLYSVVSGPAFLVSVFVTG